MISIDMKDNFIETHFTFPKYFEMLLGKKINKSVKKGTALTFDLIG